MYCVSFYYLANIAQKNNISPIFLFSTFAVNKLRYVIKIYYSKMPFLCTESRYFTGNKHKKTTRYKNKTGNKVKLT